VRNEIPNQADLRRLAALWQELADAPAAEMEAALRHCLLRLCSHIGARNAIWVAAHCPSPTVAPEDPYRGWRIQDFEYLHDGARLMAYGKEVVARIEAGAIDVSAIASAARAGTTRSLLRAELLDEESRRTDWVVHDVLASERIGDRLEGAHALTPTCESHFIFERGAEERPFTPRERNLLYLFLLGSRGFQRELLLARGIGDARDPLSLREREVLQLLLTDQTEKEIAQRLGIGYRTVHQHAQAIYAKFGVRGRVGLMAKWLRGG